MIFFFQLCQSFYGFYCKIQIFAEAQAPEVNQHNISTSSKDRKLTDTILWWGTSLLFGKIRWAEDMKIL